jgi:hypothetical protein
VKIDEYAVMQMCIERGALEALKRCQESEELNEYRVAQEIGMCVMEEIIVCFKFNNGDDNGNSCKI